MHAFVPLGPAAIGRIFGKPSSLPKYRKTTDMLPSRDFHCADREHCPDRLAIERQAARSWAICTYAGFTMAPDHAAQSVRDH